MRFGLILGLAVLLGALAWLARSSVRDPGTRSAAREAEAREAAELELLAPEVPAASGESLGEPPGAEGERDSRGRSSATRKPKSEADAAPVRGRLVLAETGDPITGTFSVRLRTLDLLRSEELVTDPDGRFAGIQLFPDCTLLALVQDEVGRELVDQEAYFDPSSSEDWLVRVPEDVWPTTLQAEIVDRRGVPRGGARVLLVPLTLGLPPLGRQWSSKQGQVRFAGLRPGPYRLRVLGRWASTEPLALDVHAGANDLGRIVLDEPPAAGDVRLRLVGVSEAWPSVRLELRGPTDEDVLRFDAKPFKTLDDGELELVLSDMPYGRYSLALESLDGRAWEPAALEFSPPAELLMRATGEALPWFEFRAEDAGSGEELLGFTVLTRAERLWSVDFAYLSVHGPVEVLPEPRGFDTWYVWAEGYRAAGGRAAESGATIRARLEPGWSQLLQFEDAEAGGAVPSTLMSRAPRVLSGVEVFADGVPVGKSDADGFLALEGESAPRVLDFQLAGMRVVGEYRVANLLRVLLARLP